MNILTILCCIAAAAATEVAGAPRQAGGAEDTPADSTGRTLAASIVESALSWLGRPYVYGGTGPDGFDCSGLVYRVFMDNGITLPRTVGAIEELGMPVAAESLRPSDLLIFDAPRHIGIYIGGGEFVHSSSWEGRGVVVTALSQANYARRFSGARRLI